MLNFAPADCANNETPWEKESGQAAIGPALAPAQKEVQARRQAGKAKLRPANCQADRDTRPSTSRPRQPAEIRQPIPEPSQQRPTSKSRASVRLPVAEPAVAVSGKFPDRHAAG